MRNAERERERAAVIGEVTFPPIFERNAFYIYAGCFGGVINNPIHLIQVRKI